MSTCDPADFRHSLEHASERLSSFAEAVDEYTETLEDYQQGNVSTATLESKIVDVEEYWRKTDWAKEDVDDCIEDAGMTVEIGDEEMTLSRIDQFVHNTTPSYDDTEDSNLYESVPDTDSLDNAVAQHRQALARFDKAYVTVLAAIHVREQPVRDDERIEYSPEELRIEQDPDYTPFNQLLEQQIELLEQGKEAF